MSIYHILVAGHGGQGILFAGEFLARAGMTRGKYVTWMPMYGPEVRGGTANCNVVVSDSPIGSPLVTQPDLFVVMNLASLERYESCCAPGAKVILNSTLIPRELSRPDLAVYYIPASKIADDNNLQGMLNMVMVGKVLRETNICSYEDIRKTLQSTLSDYKEDLLNANIRAVELGYNFPKYSLDGEV
jgi:2-oxoglutarate ferredoxin oxidoreductase subunit gamma